MQLIDFTSRRHADLLGSLCGRHLAVLDLLRAANAGRGRVERRLSGRRSVLDLSRTLEAGQGRVERAAVVEPLPRFRERRRVILDRRIVDAVGRRFQ